MIRILQVITFLGLCFPYLTQNLERGCNHIDYFYVYYDTPNLYQYPPYDYELFEQGHSHSFHPDEDTLFFELSDTNAIHIEWRFWDEYGLGPYEQSENTPYWFINDSLIDSLYYSSYYNLYSGACGMFAKAGSTLSTKLPGNYELRYLGNLKTNLPVIVVKETLANVIETNHVPNFSIFPNPANSSINLNHGNLIDGIATIYDLYGRLVEVFDLDDISTSTLLNLNSVKNGNYILTIQSNQEEVFKSRFVKL